MLKLDYEPKESHSPFFQWLMRYHNRDTMRGKLARHVWRDDCFPRGEIDQAAIRHHIAKHGANKQFLRSLAMALKSFERGIKPR